MTNIGIIGLGFVGNSMFESFTLKGMQPILIYLVMISLKMAELVNWKIV